MSSLVFLLKTVILLKHSSRVTIIDNYSCSFNNSFHHGEKVPNAWENITIKMTFGKTVERLKHRALNWYTGFFKANYREVFWFQIDMNLEIGILGRYKKYQVLILMEAGTEVTGYNLN